MNLLSVSRTVDRNQEKIYDIRYVKNECHYRCAISADSFEEALSKLKRQCPDINEQLIYGVVESYESITRNSNQF